MQRNITNWGYLLIALLISTILVSCTLKNADKGIIVDGHRFVDLQLPSGLLWAETNLGAENDTDFGDQFAWGETQMKEDYSLATYRYGTEFKKMTKYNSTDRKATLSPEDDAALYFGARVAVCRPMRSWRSWATPPTVPGNGWRKLPSTKTPSGATR